MADGIEEFKEQYPSLDSYWRSVILFGNNVASYKFALAKSLLEIAPTGKTVMQQTGMTETARSDFLKMVDQRAIEALIHRWSTPEKAPATF